MYGTDVCLIDATYRTTSYDLPLVCLCVATNVAYFNVATMLLADEKVDSITANYVTSNVQLLAKLTMPIVKKYSHRSRINYI